jgi:predicted Fe-Mo cluster-binding NifX family protein
MRIAVTSTGPTLDDRVSTEFDKSKYLLIVDFETLKYEAMVSPVMLGKGPAAGRFLAQQLLQANVSKVLASHINFNVLKSFLKSLRGTGIQIIDGMSGSVRNVVQRFDEICRAETVIMPSEEILDQHSTVQNDERVRDDD